MPGSSKFHTTNPYEAKWGYSRAVRRGPFIFVSGTTAIDLETGQIPTGLSAYEQATMIFAEITRAIVSVGGKKEDVTRVRMFVTKDEDFPEVGRALKEAFGEVGPAATGIVGVRFVSSDMKVEIEADAVVLSWCVYYTFVFPFCCSYWLKFSVCEDGTVYIPPILRLPVSGSSHDAIYQSVYQPNLKGDHGRISNTI